jgi:glycosyltransferase involved in cell wall biosynthesis
MASDSTLDGGPDALGSDVRKPYERATMKVLNVCSNFDPMTGGGEAERTFQMNASLLASGVAAQVLTIDTALSMNRKAAFGPGGVIALPCLFRRFYVPKVSPRQIGELVERFDIVHLIGHWTVLNALVYRAAVRANKPYVICPAGALSIFGRSKLLKRIYNFVIGDKIIRNASMCIAVTQEERAYFMSAGVPADRISVIPNGMSPADFLSFDVHGLREKYALGERPFILFLGRLNTIKGPDLLLEAFSRLGGQFRDFDLVFVGPDGGMLDSLRAASRQNGVGGRVHFIGYLGGAEKSSAYHAAELLVIPSRHEAMSIVALEAGICGTPVLLTDQCGFNQLSDVEGGWIAPATAEGLQQRLEKILPDPDARRRAGQNIKSYVASNYGWDVVVESYRSLYSQLLSAKRK